MPLFPLCSLAVLRLWSGCKADASSWAMHPRPCTRLCWGSSTAQASLCVLWHLPIERAPTRYPTETTPEGVFLFRRGLGRPGFIHGVHDAGARRMQGSAVVSWPRRGTRRDAMHPHTTIAPRSAARGCDGPRQAMRPTPRRSLYTPTSSTPMPPSFTSLAPAFAPGWCFQCRTVYSKIAQSSPMPRSIPPNT